MKKDIWGPCIWKTLHVLTVKIKEEYFQNQRQALLDIIHMICNHLPCPICSSHAKGLLRRHNAKQIRTKEGLIKVIFTIHNEVNKRLKKPPYVYESLISKYSSENTREVLTDYYEKNQKMKFGEKMMLYSFQRKLFLKEFKEYIQKSIDYFDP